MITRTQGPEYVKCIKKSGGDGIHTWTTFCGESPFFGWFTDLEHVYGECARGGRLLPCPVCADKALQETTVEQFKAWDKTLSEAIREAYVAQRSPLTKQEIEDTLAEDSPLWQLESVLDEDTKDKEISEDVLMDAEEAYSCLAKWHKEIPKVLSGKDCIIFQWAKVSEALSKPFVRLEWWINKERLSYDLETNINLSCSSQVEIADWNELSQSWKDYKHLCAVAFNPKAKCAKCSTIVQSLHRHDFHQCECGTIAIDGGSDYTRCVGEPQNFIWLQ